MGIKAGTQAAISAGAFDFCPKTDAISLKKKIINARIIPTNILSPIPFLPKGFTEKTPPISAIPMSIKGDASKECQCMRCFLELNPAFSIIFINLGIDQKDIVSGGEKLSLIFVLVRLVFNLYIIILLVFC